MIENIKAHRFFQLISLAVIFAVQTSVLDWPHFIKKQRIPKVGPLVSLMCCTSADRLDLAMTGKYCPQQLCCLYKITNYDGRECCSWHFCTGNLNKDGCNTGFEVALPGIVQ